MNEFKMLKIINTCTMELNNRLVNSKLLFSRSPKNSDSTNNIPIFFRALDGKTPNGLGTANFSSVRQSCTSYQEEGETSKALEQNFKSHFPASNLVWESERRGSSRGHYINIELFRGGRKWGLVAVRLETARKHLSGGNRTRCYSTS